MNIENIIKDRPTNVKSRTPPIRAQTKTKPNQIKDDPFRSPAVHYLLKNSNKASDNDKSYELKSAS